MTLRILLVESNPEETLFLRDVLEEMEAAPCWSDWVHLETSHAATWSDATAILATERVDLLLLDLTLPGFADVEMFRQAQMIAQRVPLILLIEASQVAFAEKLVREGAQDFLLMQQVDCIPLAHAIRNAIERHRLLAGAHAVSMTDQLTGLLNRVAYMKLAERDRKLAERLRCRLMFVIAEPTHLDALISAYGDHRRDLALVETADRLRSMTGSTDLLGRIGAAQFSLMVFDTGGESVEEAWARMHSASALHSLTLGAVVFDPEHPLSLDTLLERATLDLAPKALATRS